MEKGIRPMKDLCSMKQISSSRRAAYATNIVVARGGLMNAREVGLEKTLNDCEEVMSYQ